MKLKDYKSNNNIFYSSKYHIVWCPKYRRKVMTGDIAIRCQQILEYVCEQTNAELIAIEVMPEVENSPKMGHLSLKNISK